MTGWMFSVGHSEVAVGPVEYDKMGPSATRLRGESRKCAGYLRQVPSVDIYPNELECRRAAVSAVNDKLRALRRDVDKWERVMLDLMKPADLNLDAPSEGVGRG